jgi:hypothetical protein
MHLWVLEANATARRFYERQQGVSTERRIVEVTPGAYRPVLRYVWAL